MKKNNTLCLLLALLFSGYLSAQIDQEYIVSEYYVSNFNKVLVLGEDVYAVGGISSCKQSFLSHFRKDQLVEHAFPSTYGGHWHYSDIALLPGPDSLLLIAGFYRQADDFNSDEDRPYLSAVRKDNSLAFELFLSRPAESSYPDPLPKIAIMGSGDIALVSNEKVYQIAPNGDLLGEKIFEEEDFIDLKQLNDSTLVVLSKESVYWFDNSLTVIDSMKSLEDDMRGMVLQNDTIIILLENQLLSIRPPYDFFNIQKKALPNNSFESAGITGNEEALFVWGRVSNALSPSLYQLNPKNLVESKTVNLPILDLVIKDIHATDDQLILVGQQLYTGGNQGFSFGIASAFVKSMPIFEEPEFNQASVQLNSFEVVEGVERVLLDITPTDTIYYLLGEPMKYRFEVQNEGTDTLRSFTLISSRTNGFNCAIDHLFKEYNDLLIPPGGTQTIVDSQKITFTAGRTKVEFGVTAYGPNHHFQDSLNAIKVEIDKTVLNTQLEVLNDNALSIVPNPANDYFSLTFSAPLPFSNSSQLTIIDAFGRKVFQKQLDNTHSLKQQPIATQHLPAGMYIVQLSDGQYQWSQKLILQ